MTSASEPTRIDFHSNVSDPIHYACRLIRKARAANCRLVVYHPEAALLQQLSHALWTLDDSAFLPHVMADDPCAPQTPVIFCQRDLQLSPHFELLLNLSSSVPPQLSLFGRMIEIVPSTAQATALGRERYRGYQQQGFTLFHHVAN